MYGAVVKLDDLKTSTISMAWFAVKRRNPALITRDGKTGGWRQHFRQGVLISDNPRGMTWRMCQETTQELILREYTPGPGDVIVEIGSGVGTETVILSRLVGPTGRVIACEAAPRSAQLLRATVEANRMSNVEVVEVAVADKPGIAELAVRGGDSSIRNSIFLPGVSEKTETVPTTTLDDLMADLNVDRIDMLKANIEGAELLMIEGMHETLPKVRNAVISCHDFIYDKKGAGWEHTITREPVGAYFRGAGFRVNQHPGDPARPWVRDHLYITAS